MMDKKGTLYGTTDEGGSSTACGGGGCGVVFKLAPHGNSWTETVLHSFANGMDGAFPTANLVEGGSGNLYGTTFTGADGAQPEAGLIMNKNGKLSGTTLFGGANNYGAVFEVSPEDSERVLYSFGSATNGIDGILPYAGLIADKSGNLFGGAYGDVADSNGAIFKVNKH